jgi:hypothetical protein
MMKASTPVQFKHLALIALTLCFTQAALCARVSAIQLFVGTDKTRCPNATFTHIQDAINAASTGDQIRICEGLYAEQLKITMPLEIHADSGAILLPSEIQANTTSLFDSSPIAAAILVANTHSVSISGLIVDGANNGLSQCSPDLVGVMFQNASGSIDTSAIRNFKLTPFLSACQSGSGIIVQSGDGQISKVEIADNSVHDFQKNGITGDEIGTQVFIHGNVVTGLGPTSGAAQNGIQIGFGARGSITRNISTNNLSSSCTAVSTCQAVATNILIAQSDGVEISHNRVGLSQIPIYVIGNHATVRNNEAFAASVFDSIRVEGNESQITSNRLYDSAQSAIYVMGNDNLIADNSITEAPIGLFEASGSAANLHHNNRFFDTPTRVEDPSSSTLTHLLQPQR